jgi:predicted enzyme related to lactoylglutathione lyase
MLQQGLVVFAKSKKRVSAFYQQTLGLAVVESETSHDLLRGHGYEIVVHAIPRKYAAGITIARPPLAREDTPLKPTFVVASLAEVRRAVEATGGYLKPESGAWHFRGHRVLDGWDPEGNVVQFKQPQADDVDPLRSAAG